MQLTTDDPMTKIFIQRSDGRIQRYNVGKKRLSKMKFSMELSMHKGSRRKRKIYTRFTHHKAPRSRQEQKAIKVISERKYTKVKALTTTAPIAGVQLCQLHVRIRAKKGLNVVLVDGYSHIRNPTYDRDKMYDEAVEDALAQLDGYNWLYEPVYYNYISFVSNKTKTKHVESEMG